MKKYLLFIPVILSFFSSCGNFSKHKTMTRGLVDTIGYAHTASQMDSVMVRIERIQKDEYNGHMKFKDDGPAKAVLCPHDDYAYVGELYPSTLQNIKAGTVIIFGVAHKANKLHLENQIIFDSYDYWNGPYGKIKVSGLREKIIKELPKGIYQINDSMQAMEHSVEGILPFLQYFNHNVQIVSILVSPMSYNRMVEISMVLSKAINEATKEENLEWGKGFAFVISSDAVHYGDEDWGGKNFAYYGTACTSYPDTKEHEFEIIHSIAGIITSDKIKKFTQFTVDDYDYKKYKWTWCGRYSVPLGLLTVNYLKQIRQGSGLRGRVIGYTSSLTNMPLPLKDIGMGVTAPAYDHHWVGYAAIRYD